MKNLLNLFIIVLVVSLYSCNSEVLPDLDSTLLVQLNPKLTIGEDQDKPMNALLMRSQQSVQDSSIYAIQIYENGQPYYYGLFNDVSNIQIALKTSKTYKFKIAAYKNGSGLGLKSTVVGDGVYYYLPNSIKLENLFVKGAVLNEIDKPSSIITNVSQKEFKEVDVFYAEKDLIIEKGTTSVDFSLLRMGYGMNFSVDALSYGKLNIFIGNDTIVLTPARPSVFTIRQFSSSKISFSAIYNDASTYADSIMLNFSWKADNGTEVTNSAKLLFRRNVQKSIPIDLNTNMINFNFEDWIEDDKVTDADGNVYNTVVIGTQVWMVENLRTSKLNDGTSIPNITGNAEWQALTTPGYCWYNNDISNKSVYGAMYNWYAINTGKLAPSGWHVASDTEWATLRTYLISNGYNFDGTTTNNKIAKALAGNFNWITSTVIGSTGNDLSINNRTNFSALPGGYRVFSGAFDVIGHIGSWWSSTQSSSSHAKYWKIHSDNVSLDDFSSGKEGGFSVRCIKD